MGKRDNLVDEYIAAAPENQQPVLSYVRDLIHELVPDAEETIKWSTPFYDYMGHFISTASFKEHASVRFARGSEIPDVKDALGSGGAGQFYRVTSRDDLPSDEVMRSIIKQAKYLNESVPWPVHETVEREVPDDLQAALEQHPDAQEIWVNWTAAKRKDYIVWITSAKRDETRANRIDTAMEWIAANKIQNWQSVEKMKAKAKAKGA